MLAAVVVLLGSAASAAAAVLLVPVVPVPVPHEPELPALAPVLAQVLACRCPQSLLLHLLSLPLPQVVVESEVPAAPSGPPVVLSRNGKEFTANGETNVRAGTEYKVTTERPSVNINVKELDTGSWVMFELPGFTTASVGYGAEQPGCAAQGQRHLVLQGQRFAVGQGRLHR